MFEYFSEAYLTVAIILYVAASVTTKEKHPSLHRAGLSAFTIGVLTVPVALVFLLIRELIGA